MDSNLLHKLTALVANAATLRYPRESSDVFIERDVSAAALGVRVAAPRAIEVSDVICRHPRPTVAPGGLVRMLVGPGVSYVARSVAEFSAALADFRDCMEVTAVLVKTSTAAENAEAVQQTHHRRLPVVVRIDRRIGANFLFADVIVPRRSPSCPGESVLLTASLGNSLLFRSSVLVIDGHLHTSSCNHERTLSGSAYVAAVDGNLRNLQYALQPEGWALWLRGGRGASTEEMTNDGSTTPILGCAASWGDTSVVKVLLHAGADVNASNEEGETALQSASFKGYVDIVRLLLMESRTDINFSNAAGNAALHVAVSKGHADVLVSLLADSFLDTAVINHKALTALDIARARGKPNVTALIEGEVRQRWRSIPLLQRASLSVGQ